MQSVEAYLIQVKKRAKDIRPVMNRIEVLVRAGIEEQLENQHDPKGQSFKPLKAKQPMGRWKVYDTPERRTWNALVNLGGGTVVRAPDSFTLVIDTPGAFVLNGTKFIEPRPVGVSEKTADLITEVVANFLTGE